MGNFIEDILRNFFFILDQEEVLFKDIYFIFDSGSRFVQRSGIVFPILVKGNMRSISVKLFGFF